MQHQSFNPAIGMPIPFQHLVPYPNKVLLATSKPQVIKDHITFFDQRCQLMVEIAQLLLTAQAQNLPLLLSSKILLSAKGLLYMFYSHSINDAGKLKEVKKGDLPRLISHYIALVFHLEYCPSLNSQKLNILKQTRDLMLFFEEMSDKEQSFEPEPLQMMPQIADLKTFQQSLQLIKQRLACSDLFTDYSYSLMAQTGIIIVCFLPDNGKKEYSLKRKNLYVQIVGDLQHLYINLRHGTRIQDLHNELSSLEHQFESLLKLIQGDDFIKIHTMKDEGSEKQRGQPPHKKLLQSLLFTVSLHRHPLFNRTISQRSSESSQQPDSLLELQKSKEREQLLSLQKCKTEMRFNVKTYYQQKSEKKNKQGKQQDRQDIKDDSDDGSFFKIVVEAQSWWKIDQYCFNMLRQKWDEFVNEWFTASYEADEQPIFGNFRPYNIRLSKGEDGVIIKEEVTLIKHSNIVLQMVTVVDRLSLLFLLFQNIIKELWKGSQVELNLNCLPSAEEWGRDEIERLVVRIRTVIRHYNDLVRQVRTLTY